MGGHVAHGRADHQAIVNSDVNRAQTKHQAADKALKADADVVENVKAKHHPILPPRTARALGL